MNRIEQVLNGTPYASYLYGYPHKTSYRPLNPAVPLERLWSAERRDALSLYVHIPFCEMRCGFCNLFTVAGQREDFVEAYLSALEREARQVKAAIGEARFGHCAIGGGTPTLLEPEGLGRVLDLVERVMGANLAAIPASVESSPETVTPEKLALLRERGVERLSIGVQSFLEAEVASVRRPQKTAEVHQALDWIRAAGFPTLNIDLIYGIGGQTDESFLQSLREALRFKPEELYLYPLYVRPLTLLGKKGESWDDIRQRLYRTGRDFLLAEGYEQVSMRMFRSRAAAPARRTVYRCQEDGMVGLGCGARSYTRELHYSSEYAVNARAVRDILAGYIAREASSFSEAVYGVRLDADEQRRRFAILSLLGGGLSFEEYRAKFGTDALDDLPELAPLLTYGLARKSDEALVLTDEGLARSDAVGPYLQSSRIEAAMKEYAWR